MKMIIAIIAAVRWTLMEYHHIGKRTIEQIIVFDQHGFQNCRQFLLFGFSKIGQSLQMPPRIDMNLVRISGEKRHDRSKGFVFANHTPGILSFIVENVAYQTATGLFMMEMRLFQFALNTRWKIWKAIYLPMRVIERNADGFAFVFKDENVFDKFALG